MSAAHVSPTVARMVALAAWLARVLRPCGHDPGDVREEREGIVCSVCDRPYRARGAA